MLPTTLMIRLSEFIYETLFLKLLQTTIAVKKLLIIREDFAQATRTALPFLLSLIFDYNYKALVFKKSRKR